MTDVSRPTASLFQGSATRLSEHFALAEFVHSDTAMRKGIDNTPSSEIVAALAETAEALEEVRALLGRPLNITSGYRCAELNRAVGGVGDSAHLYGFAADFVCPAFGEPLAICQALEAGDLLFDQVIQEGTWVHISFDPRMRRQVLTKTAGGYAEGLKETTP